MLFRSVVSPSETARDLDRKVDACLAGGSHAVWLFYRDTKKVRIHLADGTILTRTGADLNSAPDLFPG